jgi:hypothetical protein
MRLTSFTNANLASGAVLVPFTLFVYPAYSKRVGPLKTCLGAITAAVPATLIIPAARFLAPAHPILVEVASLAGPLLLMRWPHSVQRYCFSEASVSSKVLAHGCSLSHM